MGTSATRMYQTICSGRYARAHRDCTSHGSGTVTYRPSARTTNVALSRNPMSSISTAIWIEPIVEQPIDVARRRDVPPMLPCGGLHGRIGLQPALRDARARHQRESARPRSMRSGAAAARPARRRSRPPATLARLSTPPLPGRTVSSAAASATTAARGQQTAQARQAPERPSRVSDEARTPSTGRTAGSFSAEIDQANRLGRNSSSASPTSAGSRPNVRPDRSIQNDAAGEIERHAEQMHAVRRRPDEDLNERQHVQVAGGAVFVEGVDEIRAVDRNAERRHCAARSSA